MMKLFKVTYKKGLGSPVLVEAETAEMAVKLGLAEFRRTNGSSEMCDMKPAEKVVEKAEEA